MRAILEYMITMIPFMLLVLPVTATLRAVYFKKKPPERFNPYHEIALYIWILLLAGLAAHTLLPRLTMENGALTLAYEGLGGVNLIPFHFIEEIYIEVVRYHNTEYFIINFLGNIGIFIPIGLLPPLLWRCKTWQVIALGCGISLLIEISQLFLPRSTDIDDFILNSLGVILGYVLYLCIPQKEKFRT